MDLATVETLTQMEVLKHVRDHLLKQGHQSLGPDGKCLYRGPKGRKCGAGCLMSNDDYDRLNKLQDERSAKPSIEGFSWGNLCTAGMVSKVHEKLIKALQNVHDAESIRNWRVALKQVERDIREGLFDNVPGDVS